MEYIKGKPKRIGLRKRALNCEFATDVAIQIASLWKMPIATI